MKKAIAIGLSFIAVSLACVGVVIYYLMESNDVEVREHRFVEYEQCLREESLSPVREQSCDRYLIGRGTMRPGDLTDSEHKDLEREYRKQQRKMGLLFDAGRVREDFYERLETQDQQEITNEKKRYAEWRSGRQ